MTGFPQDLFRECVVIHKKSGLKDWCTQIQKHRIMLIRAMSDQEHDDVGLQQRLILHYSKMADWLETRPWYRDNHVVRAVRSLISVNPSRVLELCCGTGLLLKTLSDIFPTTDFIGVDISPVMAERARKRLSGRKNVQILNQDWVYQLGSQWDHAFDVIIVKNALHLLDAVPTKLRDLSRVSNPLTTLIVVETVSPNADANEFIRRLFHFADSEHLKQTLFTEKTLTVALQQAGWLMAQNKPKYVRQHIDTNDWLEQRCGDPTALASARKLLSETKNRRVRRSLDFDTGPGLMPSRMLRLQYIARHLFMPIMPTIEFAEADNAADLIQGQLL